MILSPKYKPFLKLMSGQVCLELDKVRIILLTGGRNSQKSFVSSTGLVTSMFTESQNILYTRYTMTAAEKSIIPEFRQKIELLNYEKYFSITQNSIELPSYKSKILFSGIKASSGNQTANLKGLKDTSIFCLDEAEEMVDEESFDKIVYSVRHPFLRNFIIVIMNPADREHFIYQKYIENSHRIEYVDGAEIEISTHPSVLHIHTTYLDNLKNIRQEVLSEILETKEKNIEKFKHVFLGQWKDVSEFIPFNKNRLKRFNLNEFDLSVSGMVCAACDTKLRGTDFFAYIIAVIHDHKVFIVDCVFTQSAYEVAVPQIDALIEKYNVRMSVVESNAAGIIFLNNFIKKHPQRAWKGIVHDSTATKINRIMFQHQNIIDKFIFRNDYELGSDYDKMMTNLTKFREDGKNDHDEAPDTLSMLSAMTYNLC